jgi:hypothetical protein
MRTSDWVVVGMLLASCGCSCAPAVDGVLADDVLPAVSPAGTTEHVHTLVAPESGDLDIRFERQDRLEGYAGPVYLFVTQPDCVSVSNDTVSMRNGQAFRPLCPVLANSYGEDLNCCMGRVRLASPARVKRGQTVKVFVYGLSQPGPLPYRLTYSTGDAQCRSDTRNGPS